jgi:hypothetical protein
MGRVDIANQLHIVYETYWKAQRSWWPLFYWYLDIALVNAYHISHILHAKRQLPRLTHAEFREALYKDLFTQGCQQNQPELGLENAHMAIRGEKRQYCHWCKLQRKRDIKLLRPKQTFFTCQICQIPLCKPGLMTCWRDFHLPRAPLSERDVNSI